MVGLRGPRLPPAGILLLLPLLPLLLLPAAPAHHRASYKPVIVVHGLFDSSHSFRHLLEYINEVWQGTLGCGALEASTTAGEGECGTENRPSGPAQFLGSCCSRGESWVGDEILGSNRAQRACGRWPGGAVEGLHSRSPVAALPFSHRHTLGLW